MAPLYETTSSMSTVAATTSTSLTENCWPCNTGEIQSGELGNIIFVGKRIKKKRKLGNTKGAGMSAPAGCSWCDPSSSLSTAAKQPPPPSKVPCAALR